MSEYGIEKYRLNTTRLKRGLIRGFDLEAGGILRSSGENRSVRSIILPGLDSGLTDCKWGRAALEYRLAPECVLTVRAFASNQDRVVRGEGPIPIDDFLLDPEIPDSEKERLFLLGKGVAHTGSRDMLLSGQEGRWLWLWLEVEGEGASCLEDLRIYVPGDNFLGTLPMVYQENNDFLRRYLTIFSTMFQDFQEEIESVPDLLDVDLAPDRMLPVFASWLGIETDDTLFTPDELRKLLKAAPQLLARKGSRWAVESVVKLFLDVPVYVVEYNLLSPEQRSGSELYGSTPYDFTVMVGCQMEDKLRRRLEFLVDQFRPIRSRCRIVFLADCGGLDNFTYLDMNGAVLQSGPGKLDDGRALTGMTYLE